MKNSGREIEKFVRAANYISVAQIFLRDNFLLKRPLSFSDVKPRLLGHWGTCPGINFIYAELNALIKKHNAETLFVLGPGHGFPALQANLFMEGTLAEYYPRATRDAEGLAYICRQFSWPRGFSSHSNPGTPGVILEGGELGYALSTAYGAALDHPRLIVACVIGDGEAETGPTATAWHLHRLIDPAENGMVLPILHVNGYKISGPTIFGRLANEELTALFEGYGYQPTLIEGADIFEKADKAFESAYRALSDRQTAAREKSRDIPRPPLLILKTPKGWGGVKELHGTKIEGNFASHQVPLTKANTDPDELNALEKWLRSYIFSELFDEQNGFAREILDSLPPKELRMGGNKRARGELGKNLLLPDPALFSEDASIPGTVGSSSMRRAGLYLKEVFRLNKDSRNFRLFSPDETYSNKLDAIFEETARSWNLPVETWDKDISPSGRVMEMLSEHSLQGLAQGYILTGRHAVFASYEAFIQIVSSMVDQYAKFLKQARDISWRTPVPSLNYILTSSGWRQEHNGFSHQNPGFIGDLLEKQGCFINVYFPPDGNSTLVVLDHCLKSTNSINVIVAGKTKEPRWLTIERAREELREGLAIWDFASDPKPDVVFAAAGDYLTKEALAAIQRLKREAPEIKTRFVSILELSALGLGNPLCRLPLDVGTYFTDDKPVILNFHGYPDTVKPFCLTLKNPQRVSVHGYIENGSTTTPFDMQVINETSRLHLVLEAVSVAEKNGVLAAEKARKLRGAVQAELAAHKDYIQKYGVDMPEIEEWRW